MADIRINSLPSTASASSSDDFLALDGATNGTRKLNAYSPTFGGNLTVSGIGTIGSGGTGATTGTLLLSGSSANDTGPYITFSRNSVAKGYIGTASGVTGGSSDNLVVYTSALAATFSGANTTLAGNLTVSGTGTSSVAGNLGIGTTSPASRLHVKDATGTAVTLLTLESAYSNPSGNKSLLWTDGSGNGLGRISISYDATNGSRMSFGSLYNSGYQTSDLMTLASSGNLGIGTTSPVTTLNVVKTLGSSGTIANSLLHLGSAGSLGNIYPITFGYSGSSAVNPPAFIGMQITDANSYTNGALVFGVRSVTTDTLPTEAMRVASSGNLLLKSDGVDGGQKLQVSGTGLLSANLGGNGFVLNVNNVGGNAVLQLMGSTAASHLRTLTNGSLNLITGGTDGSLGTTALTLDSSQNATFEGTATFGKGGGNTKFSANGTTAESGIFTQANTGFVFFADNATATKGIKVDVNNGGLTVLSGGLTTATAGGSAGTWKLGVYSATAPSATGYVTIDIGGTTYKLLAST